MNKIPFGTRWSIPFAGFLLALMGGISYAWGIFVVPMKTSFGWSTAESNLPLTVFMIVFALAMVPAGLLQDKLGPKIVSFFGAGLFFLAYTLASLITVFPHVWWLVLTYGILGGVACACVYACVAPPARKWFPDKPGLAVASAVMGFGLAAVFVAPLKATYLIPNFGVSGTLFILGVIITIVCLAASLIIRNPPRSTSDPYPAPSKSLDNKYSFVVSMVLNSTFRRLWLTFACVIAGGLMIIGLIPTYGSEVLGLSMTESALAISIFAGINGLGRPIAGYLSDHFGIFNVMIVTYLIQALTFFAIPLFVVDQVGLYTAAALLGWGYAVTLALFPNLTAMFFGTASLGLSYGLVFTAFGVGALSPFVSSIIYDITSNYTSLFITAGILSLLGQMFVLRQRNRSLSVMS